MISKEKEQEIDAKSGSNQDVAMVNISWHFLLWRKEKEALSLWSEFFCQVIISENDKRLIKIEDERNLQT